MQPAIEIPVNYEEVRRIEETRGDDIGQGYIIRFNALREAQAFKEKHGGVVIREQDGSCYYVFPKAIEGYVGVISYKEEG